MPTIKKFHYRVKVCNPKNEIGEFVANVAERRDENARRMIVGEELKLGNRVLRIDPTDETSHRPGDLDSRSYGS